MSTTTSASTSSGKTALPLLMLSIALAAIADCGRSPPPHDEIEILTTAPADPSFLAAQRACGLTATAPALEWTSTIPCADRRYICCIAPDRGSEYDLAANTIRLAAGNACRPAMLAVNLPCEMENAVTWQNGSTIDRCITPCSEAPAP
jgi:hypothetical protein